MRLRRKRRLLRLRVVLQCCQHLRQLPSPLQHPKGLPAAVRRLQRHHSQPLTQAQQQPCAITQAQPQPCTQVPFTFALTLAPARQPLTTTLAQAARCSAACGPIAGGLL